MNGRLRLQDLEGLSEEEIAEVLNRFLSEGPPLDYTSVLNDSRRAWAAGNLCGACIELSFLRSMLVCEIGGDPGRPKDSDPAEGRVSGSDFDAMSDLLEANDYRELCLKAGVVLHGLSSEVREE